MGLNDFTILSHNIKNHLVSDWVCLGEWQLAKKIIGPTHFKVYAHAHFLSLLVIQLASTHHITSTYNTAL